MLIQWVTLYVNVIPNIIDYHITIIFNKSSYILIFFIQH